VGRGCEETEGALEEGVAVDIGGVLGIVAEGGGEIVQEAGLGGADYDEGGEGG